jgi:outer membrane protein assembly factor BamB
LYVPYNINTQPELKWQLEISGGASGGMVIYADGTIVIAGKENKLLAISPQGDVIWETALLAMPVGTPALDAQGQIYVADVEGYISAFDKQGNLLWRVEASATRQATSGPIVASNGMIYVTMIDALVGVSPDGVLVWRKTAATVYVDSPPRLSADERLVYLKDTALDSMTGAIQEIPIRPKAEVLFTEPAFFTGSDGGNYYRNGHEVIRWYQNESSLQIETGRTWKYDSFVLFNPINQGILPNQLAWLFYSSDFSDGRVIWLDKGGRLVGNFEFPFTNSRLIAMGENGEAYLCGPTGSRIKCVLAMPGDEKAQWEIFIENNSRPIGGALVHGTLYVVSADEMLYALSSSQP